jgi:HPt (histidine-containing phosphotransfer) domain-containing protein
VSKECNSLGISSEEWQTSLVMPQVESNLIDAASAIVESAEASSKRRFDLIASKIEDDPDLLKVALANLDRWLARGHSSINRLNGWRRMIQNAQSDPQGLRSLLDLLRDDSAGALQWKAFHPFPGLLSEDELEMLSWTSIH